MHPLFFGDYAMRVPRSTIATLNFGPLHAYWTGLLGIFTGDQGTGETFVVFQSSMLLQYTKRLKDKTQRLDGQTTCWLKSSEHSLSKARMYRDPGASYRLLKVHEFSETAVARLFTAPEQSGQGLSRAPPRCKKVLPACMIPPHTMHEGSYCK